MKKRLASLIALAVIGFAITGHTAVVEPSTPPSSEAIVTPLTYNGTTVGGPTFNRPNANGNSAPTALSTTGTAVPFDLLTFTVATAGTYSFLSVGNYDNFLVLYTGTFNPATPLTGALIANDDFPTIGRSGFNYALTTGTTYSLVTTGFSNTSVGTFTNTISAVPEPGTYVMIGAGCVALFALQRARRRTA